MDVVIDDVDTEGRYIRLSNMGDEEVPLGSWCIKSTAGDLEIIFKFHQRQIIKPRKSITVSLKILKAAFKHVKNV